jgi:hypothetical protein
MRHCALASVALLLFTLSGCGDKTKDKGESGGEADSLARKLVGKWEADTSAVEDALQGAAADNPLAGALAAATPQMSFTFNQDGTFSLSASALGQSQTFNGTWAATAESGNTLTLKMTVEGRTQTDNVQFLSDDQIKLPGKDGQPDAILNRAK